MDYKPNYYLTTNLVITYLVIAGCYYLFGIKAAVLIGIGNIAWVLIIWLSESISILQKIHSSLNDTHETLKEFKDNWERKNEQQ